MFKVNSKNLRPSNRGKKQLINKNKKRKLSSTNWISRQINDPYVLEAKNLGYKSRAAFKLLQINSKYNFLKRGKYVIDLGCAPGGWLQVSSEKVFSTNKKIKVVGVDLLPVENLNGVKTIVGDINCSKTSEDLLSLLDKKPDVILSDMAAKTIGHKKTDHLRTTYLIEVALNFSINNLSKGGVFLVKTFQGGSEQNLLNIMKKNFSIVKNIKPDASRKESVESYTICMDLKA